MHIVSSEQPFDVIDCVQRTPEWLAARAGRVTSSKMHLVFQQGRGGAESKQRRDYLMQLACERVSGVSLEDPDEWRGKWVERGRVLEAEARGSYEAREGVIVQTVGFLAHRDMAVGASLDGFIGSTRDVVTEFKVPKPATHWNYIEKGVLPEDYQFQVMTHLWVTGCARVDFISYCPAMKKELRFFVRGITRDDFSQEWWHKFDMGLATFLSELRRLEQAMLARAESLSLHARAEALRGV